METRHKLDEVQQQLQERSSHAAQQEHQHSQAVARLTQDLQQEQQARSGVPSTFHACPAIVILVVSLAGGVHWKTGIILLLLCTFIQLICVAFMAKSLLTATMH